RAAMQQMRGGFSAEIKRLREKLVHFASMVELELDFGEEDVEFADRDDLRQLVEELQKVIQALIDSFDVGNVIKNGVPTVIAGKPNAGKSTLLNALLQEEKAIVSDIAGTTRDFIEDELILGGVSFRFIDTAGLRETTDTVEAMGVERTQAKMKEASLILYLFDLKAEPLTEILQEVNRLENQGIPFIPIGNKIDQASEEVREALEKRGDFALISAKAGEHLEVLKELVLAKTQLDSFRTGDTLVTNVRHYDSLLRTRDSLGKVLEGLAVSVTGDFLAMDIRQALHYLGEITGEITTDDLLANIFSKFCIGK
ncbi:MAG TPA: tRNA uridine-5-carboxymethylaminomethyl(34) synthesis GTPase MnmE, partial [Cytophagales bacterium]|nr:tRNA uridine-5-carboxymethylaminomethyl(34) synthesis GTPase MnmE [Cytophagales bacterium]